MSGWRLAEHRIHRGLRVLLVCLLLVDTLRAAPPAWWASRGVIDSTRTPDDYAAANIGQLKNFAIRAAAELNANLPQGAGQPVNDLVHQWTTPPAAGVTRDDYAALTLGQLKFVAQLFYDRLILVHYASAYPWVTSGLPADDTAVAKLGQLKYLFNFDVAYSTLNDGLPDWWVQYYNLGRVTDPSVPGADTDGDGVTNLQEFQNGTDPTDYYNGQTVILNVVSGGGQAGPPGSFLSQPIVVSVMKADGVTPWTGTPVTFTADPGLGGFATAGDGSQSPQTQLTVNTDTTTGLATVYFQPAASVTGSGYATTGHQQKSFVESGYDQNADPAVAPTLQTSSPSPGQTTLTWNTNSTSATSTTVQQWTYATGWQTIATGLGVSGSITIATPATGVTAYQVVSNNDITASQSSPSSMQSADGSDLSTTDTDADGLTDLQEIQRGSDPNNPNTSGTVDANGNPILDGQKAFLLDPNLKIPAVPESNYAVVDLTTLGFVNPEAINDSLQILDGFGVGQPQKRIWTNGTFAVIPDMTYSGNMWIGLSNTGMVVYTYAPSSTSHGLLCAWAPGMASAITTSYDLQGCSTWGDSPFGITPSGVVYGWTTAYNPPNSPGYYAGLFWNTTTGDIGTLGDYETFTLDSGDGSSSWTGSTFWPFGGSSTGVIAGQYRDYSASGRYAPGQAAICYNGSVTPLPCTTPAYAVSVNASIPPIAIGSDGLYGLAYWAPTASGWEEKPITSWSASTNRNLPVWAEQTNINNRCEITGYFFDANNKYVGNLWQNSHVVDLDTRTADSGYRTFDPIQINNNGAILANATRISDGAYVKVLLFPVEFRLLNGDQTGMDGVDFDGKRPTTIDDPDIVDNATTQNDIRYNTNHDLLGVDPPGGGRQNEGGAGYDVSLMMTARVANLPGITYSWDRVYRNRAVAIIKTSGSTGDYWLVKCENLLSKDFPTGFPNPIADWVNAAGTDNTIIPSSKNVLYAYDIPGMSFPEFNDCRLDDYAYEETDYTYTITVTQGQNKSSFKTHVGQTALAQYSPANVAPGELLFHGLSIATSTIQIPSCIITEDKIRKVMTGIDGGLPIVLDPHVNDPDPNP